ncbi:MAG TPA: alanine racemase [Lachnospiraceae bacterium]|nr:alanine racemase [Lachnospiraceae bacterium]
MKKYSRVRADIDLDAVLYNFENMKANIRPGCKITAVIKADGYGHGSVQIAELMEPYDYMWGFAVAAADEAFRLRRAGIRKPIMLLGYTFDEFYEDLIRENVRICVFDYDTAVKVSDAAFTAKKKAIIHIALDTGMSRIGFRDNDASVAEIVKIAKLPNIEIEGLFTHFARADEVSIDPAVRQLERYDAFAEKVEKAGVDIPIHHVSNSAGIIRLREANKDMVRAGITVYGLMPSADVETDIVPLKPVMSLISHISYVKNIEAGDEVSYGGTFKAEKTMRVATIPVGYADGYPRMLSGKGHVLIKGRKAPILGRVCMDQFMVDVTDIEGATRGDEVVLLGKQGDERITAEELGDLSGRFNYELVCDISKRVPRNFIYEGRIIEQSECI